MYNILISKEAQKKLKSLAKNERFRVAEKIAWLGRDPDDVKLDIKPLEGEKGYFRLRVGDWRIIFSRDDVIELINIEKIKARGDAYK